MKPQATFIEKPQLKIINFQRKPRISSTILLSSLKMGSLEIKPTVPLRFT